jgi:sporulation protein YlmC with PRC-barrel domain
MTIKASSMGNLPIITINDGKTISKVRDIIYDGQTNQVKALLIDEKGFYTGAKI